MPKTNQKQLFHVLASGGETGQDFSVFLLGWGSGVVWAIEVRYQDLRLHLLSIFMLRWHHLHTTGWGGVGDGVVGWAIDVHTIFMLRYQDPLLHLLAIFMLR